MHRAVVPVAAAVLLLAGCGSGSSGGSALPTVGASSGTTTAPVSPSETASATPTVDPSPWTALPTRDVGPNKGVYSGAVLRSSVAETAEEKAAVDAWLNFWVFLTDAGYEVRVDKAELAQVASGAAAENIQAYVKDLKSKKRRTVGWVSLNVTEVNVLNGVSLMKACADNGTYDVDRASGKRLEQGSVAFDTEAAVRKVAGDLVVTSSGSTVRKNPCPTRK